MTYGFIGTGNMGGALVRAAAKAVPADSLYLADADRSKAEALARELGAHPATAAQIAALCGMIFLCVKPQTLETLFAEIAPVLHNRAESCTLVSIAAGVPIAKIRRLSGETCPVIRVMPNLPAAVHEGALLYTPEDTVSPADTEAFQAAMKEAGQMFRIPESLMDAGSALSGCGPGFVCLMAEALADGAVLCGLPRDIALRLAEQTLLGTAKLLLETGTHPAVLKDAVCSPGGTTIEGVQALEDGALRGTLMKAVSAAFEKTRKLGK